MVEGAKTVKEKKSVETENLVTSESKETKPIKTPSKEVTSPAKPKPEIKKPDPSPQSNLGGRIKNWIIILLLLVIIFAVGTFFLWKTGINNLKDDTKFLIIVQEKGVAKAGSYYDVETDKTDIINVEELGAVSNLKTFYREASKSRKIDGLIVINVKTITQLSNEEFLEYNGKKIPSDEVGGYIIGSLWDVNIAGNDPPWMFRAKLLSEWVELYDQKVIDAKYGSQVYRTIFTDYRSGKISYYPRNTALILLKYIPLEQILL